MVRRATAALALAALGAALAAGCGGDARARSSRVAVAVAPVEKRAVPFALLSTGTVEPLQHADVGSQVGGVVTRVAFREGDDVAEGQVLFQLDPRPFRAALAQAQATLARDLSQAETSRLEAERARKLFEEKVISQAEWDQKRTAAAGWAATVMADSASLATARLNLEYSSIRAPISGRTGRLLVHEGDYMRAATAEPLVTINQVRPVRVSFTVPASAVPLVQRYRRDDPLVMVTRTGADTAWIEGRLSFVDNALDASSGTLLLKGQFPNRDGHLVPGEFVGVRLVLYVERDATVVPAAAVTNGQEGPFVYVLNADSTVAPRSVTVARTVDELAVLSRGVQAGETVITDGQLRLSPGAKVLVRPRIGAAP